MRARCLCNLINSLKCCLVSLDVSVGIAASRTVCIVFCVSVQADTDNLNLTFTSRTLCITLSIDLIVFNLNLSK